MPETGYTFDWDAVERIQAVVSDFESRPLDGSLATAPGYQPRQISSWCKVLAEVAGIPGLYTARVVFTTDKREWRGGGDCYVQEVNSARLTINSTVQGRALAYAINARPVFGVTAGGGGNSQSGGVVLVIGALDGSFYKAGTCAHNGTAWACQPVDDFAIDVNGLPLEMGRRYVGSLIGTRNGKSLYGVQTWWGVVTDVMCDATGLHQTKREI